jgi:hypothetical protein
MLSKWYAHRNFMILPTHFIIIRPIHKCEILTLQNNYSIFDKNVCR